MRHRIRRPVTGGGLKEKRAAKRKAFSQEMMVEALGGWRACLIMDISHTGCRLQIPPTAHVPKVFRLLITPNGKVYRRCEIVWREGVQMGVKFVTMQALVLDC